MITLNFILIRCRFGFKGFYVVYQLVYLLHVGAVVGAAYAFLLVDQYKIPLVNKAARGSAILAYSY